MMEDLGVWRRKVRPTVSLLPDHMGIDFLGKIPPRRVGFFGFLYACLQGTFFAFGVFILGTLSGQVLNG